VLVVYRKLSEVEPYAKAVENAGLQPVLEEAREGLKIGQWSGLLLTGGTDVDPALYGESAAPQTDVPDKERDAAVQTAKGGSSLRRFARAAKWLLIGAVAGALSARAAR